MTLTTRKPTGKPSWPILLIAGAEKAGKSWACAQASSSELVGRTLWVGIGEDDPDEYGNIPGSDFDIVVHDGTYRGIRQAVLDAAAEPHGDLPTLLVVDSMTRLWEVICDDVQQLANRRAAEKARKYNKPVPAEDVQITMDLWNIAKDRWYDVFEPLRQHQGPVLVTARLEEVTVMTADGKPTTQKEWKVKANKGLPFDVGGVVELPARGEAYLRGLRSVAWQLDKRTQIPDFTVDRFWRRMGLDTLDLAPREHSGATAAVQAEAPRTLQSVPDAPAAQPEPAAERDWYAEVEAAPDAEALRTIYRAARDAGVRDDALTASITEKGQALAAGAA